MYITINDIIGEKTIDLFYPIHSTTGRGEARKEIAIVSMHISNSQILLGMDHYFFIEGVNTFSVKKTVRKL